MRATKYKIFTAACLLTLGCICSSSVFANDITDHSITRTEGGTYQLAVTGRLEQKVLGEPVNMWMYKDNKIVRIDQTTTNKEGEYEFIVNMSLFDKGGTFKVKTIAKIEDADEEIFDFYSSEEIEYVYKTLLFEEVDSSYGVTQENTANIAKAMSDNKHVMKFTDKRYENYINDDVALYDIASFVANEIGLMKNEDATYDKDKMIDLLVYTMAVKGIDYCDDADVIKNHLISKDEDDRLEKINVLGLGDNKALKLFDSNATYDARLDKSETGKLSDEEYKEKEKRYISLAENIIANGQKYKDSNDFVSKLEDAIIVTDLERCRGNEKLEKLIFLYAETAQLLDLTKYNDSKNDKEKVLKNILLKFEKSQLTTVKQLQDLLDTNILKKEEGFSSTSGGGSSKPNRYGGLTSSVIIPQTTFNQDDVVKPDIPMFKDMENYSWAKESVDALVELNMLNGYSNERFAPEENITRAQFAKMICSVFGIEKTDSDTGFIDVEKNSWYAGYVIALKNSGYINGIDENRFGSEYVISRQDAFSIIYRIMKDRNMISEEFDVADFFDWHEVSDYAKTAVGTLSKFGIVQGSNGSISPLNNMIRAEGAVMMYRIYKEVLQ